MDTSITLLPKATRLESPSDSTLIVDNQDFLTVMRVPHLSVVAAHFIFDIDEIDPQLKLIMSLKNFDAASNKFYPILRALDLNIEDKGVNVFKIGRVAPSRGASAQDMLAQRWMVEVQHVGSGAATYSLGVNIQYG